MDSVIIMVNIDKITITQVPLCQLIKYFLAALIIGHAISASLQCEYESCPNYGNPIIHTMCEYPSADYYGAECHEVIKSGLTDAEKEELLNHHNKLRAKVAAGEESRGSNGGQPGGIIRSLEWDEDLAIVAQRWANQCIFAHDKCRDIHGIEIGQNLGYTSYTDKFPAIVTSWYDEVEKFNHQYVSNYQQPPYIPGAPITTHYTQLIWGKTTHVGCGGTKYKKDGSNIIHLVCNYRVRGNMIGDAVYEINDQSGGRLTSESDERAPPSIHVNQFPKEYTGGFIDESDKKAPPFIYSDTFSTNAPGREFPKERSETSSDYPNILADLPEKNHVKKSPQGNYNQFYNGNTYQRPSLPINRPFNRNQNGYSRGCAYDQCEDKRERGTYKQHTMCQYPIPAVANTCGQAERSQLNELEQRRILDLHNKFKNNALQEISRHNGISRDKPIGYAGPLRWNPKLAEVAQRWANQCIYNKDECRNIDGIEVGQNVGQISAEHEFPVELPDIVEAWYDVRDHYDDNGNKLHFKYDSEYYEQLIWTGATDIGCGGIRYVEPKSKLFITYLVCNYMPTKNIARKPIQTPVRPIKRPNYPPRNNVPVQKPIRRAPYKPASVILNPALEITDRLGGNDCQYQPCADPKKPGKYNIHTMCHYLSMDPAKECHDVKKSSLNQEEKNRIIEIHKNLMHSANFNVELLQWNDELEQIAQRWANQCRSGIDECRNMHDGSPVRQSFGLIKKENAFHSDFYHIIDSWNRDAPAFKDNLTQIGCGIVEYNDVMYNTYLVCNYKTPSLYNRQIMDSSLHIFGTEF
ncbi:hypothetical protein PV327_001442 [Microctonus hyperodae]|uniref:SCP domain-containing protein n=1 Tax=Microctonus hyperodae TaxID=165561 RepID=A0AA39G8R0_MICHY|nr:hypothetical protein PV327_001442 [Microctonus hyperodae]